LLPAALRSGASTSGEGNKSITSYQVQKGDSVSSIASHFGISVKTVLNANPSLGNNPRLKTGQMLLVPFVSGVVYRAKEGDTLEAISERFRISLNDIRSANQGSDLAVLEAGMIIVIPGAEPAALASAESANENQLRFMQPAQGFNWGRLHNHNAVDIANSCGTPVKAAADGVVIPDPNFGDGNGSWNGGYGKFILIEHSKGVKTRYAHLQKLSASPGDSVKQGEVIGLMGETGEATGCHVHFEVYGTTNPFVK
jgi:murein DD-endopeptidase MepM/ murein hydrolase activator NlpD